MIASKLIKSLLTGVAAVAFIGTAIAQGTPPNAAKSAPIGAGQQSSQGTPMGVTGTQSGSSATGGSTAAGSTSGGSTMGTASSSGTGSTGSRVGSGTSMGSSSTSADTSMTPRTSKRSKRMARADRN